jgi:hypothetical protein
MGIYTSLGIFYHQDQGKEHNDHPQKVCLGWDPIKYFFIPVLPSRKELDTSIDIFVASGKYSHIGLGVEHVGIFVGTHIAFLFCENPGLLHNHMEE